MLCCKLVAGRPHALRSGSDAADNLPLSLNRQKRRKSDGLTMSEMKSGICGAHSQLANRTLAESGTEELRVEHN